MLEGRWTGRRMKGNEWEAGEGKGNEWMRQKLCAADGVKGGRPKDEREMEVCDGT